MSAAREMLRTELAENHAAEMARSYRSLPAKVFAARKEPSTPFTEMWKQEQWTLSQEASTLEAYLGERGLAWFTRGTTITVHGASADIVWECTSVVRSDPDADGDRELLLAVYYPTWTSMQILSEIRPGAAWRLEIFND